MRALTKNFCHTQWILAVKGRGGFKKLKLVMKIFFQMLNKVIKSCKKMIFADTKTDILKQQKIKELVAVFCNF